MPAFNYLEKSHFSQQINMETCKLIIKVRFRSIQTYIFQLNFHIT